MKIAVYETIDRIGSKGMEALEGSRLDLSYGLLRAVERSLWGDLSVRYVAVEESGQVLSLAPIYIGSNLNVNALMPRFMQRSYAVMIDKLGLASAYRVAIVGSLISDRGWIPMCSDCDRAAVLDLMLSEIDRVAREEQTDFCFIKDIHEEFPDTRRFLLAGFTRAFSLPTVRVPTAYESFDAYLGELTKNGRKHARKTFRKGEDVLTLRTVVDYMNLIPVVYPLFRKTYLKALYQFEELPPQFFKECASAEHPCTELLLCEKAGRIVGAMLIIYDGCDQLNKRIGLDYEQEETGLVYNLLMFQGLRIAIERGIQSVYLGQSTYIPKTRMGGKLEDQFIFLKAYSTPLRISVPVQRLWMRRYCSQRIMAILAQDIPV